MAAAAEAAAVSFTTSIALNARLEIVIEAG